MSICARVSALNDVELPISSSILYNGMNTKSPLLLLSEQECKIVATWCWIQLFFYFLFSRMSWQESFQTFCWTRVAVITNLPCCHVMSQCEKTANVVSRCMDTVFCVTFYISNVFEHTTTLNSNVRPFFFHIHLALAVCQLMYIYPAF